MNDTAAQAGAPGPIDLFVLSFDTPTVGTAVIDSMAAVVASGAITILDLVFLSVDKDGTLSVVEAEAVPDRLGFSVPDLDSQGMISDEDLELVREGLEPGSSALVVVFENTWARAATTAIMEAGGQVELHVRVPADVALAALRPTARA
jgi:hypothetical protein